MMAFVYYKETSVNPSNNKGAVLGINCCGKRDYSLGTEIIHSLKKFS